MISDYAICIFTRVGVTSTYLYFKDFACILNISQIGTEKAHHNILYQESIWNLFHNTIGIVKSEKIQGEHYQFVNKVLAFISAH